MVGKVLSWILAVLLYLLFAVACLALLSGCSVPFAMPGAPSIGLPDPDPVPMPETIAPAPVVRLVRPDVPASTLHCEDAPVPPAADSEAADAGFTLDQYGAWADCHRKLSAVRKLLRDPAP